MLYEIFIHDFYSKDIKNFLEIILINNENTVRKFTCSIF